MFATIEVASSKMHCNLENAYVNSKCKHAFYLAFNCIFIFILTNFIVANKLQYLNHMIFFIFIEEKAFACFDFSLFLEDNGVG